MERRYGWVRRVAAATALTTTLGLVGLPLAAAVSPGPVASTVSLADWNSRSGYGNRDDSSWGYPKAPAP